MGSSWQAAFGFVLTESDQLCTQRHSPQLLFPPGNMDGFALVDGEELPVYSPDFWFPPPAPVFLACVIFFCLSTSGHEFFPITI